MAASVPKVMPLPENAVATVPLRRRTDEWQAVVAFNDLAGPAAIDLGLRQKTVQGLLQVIEEGAVIRRLPGLVVKPAEDRVIAPRTPIDPKVVIRLARVPKRCFRRRFRGSVPPMT